MLPNGGRPPGHRTTHLASEGPEPKKPVPQFEDCPADVDGMHFLVLPSPEECMSDDFPHVVADSHRFQTPADQILAITNGNNLFPLQGEQAKYDHLVCRRIGVPTIQCRKFLLKVFVDSAHNGSDRITTNSILDFGKRQLRMPTHLRTRLRTRVRLLGHRRGLPPSDNADAIHKGWLR